MKSWLKVSKIKRKSGKECYLIYNVSFLFVCLFVCLFVY